MAGQGAFLWAIALVLTGLAGFIGGHVTGFDDGFQAGCADADAVYYMVGTAMHCESPDTALKAQGMRRAAEMLEGRDANSGR